MDVGTVLVTAVMALGFVAVSSRIFMAEYFRAKRRYLLGLLKDQTRKGEQ